MAAANAGKHSQWKRWAELRHTSFHFHMVKSLYTMCDDFQVVWD